MFFNISSKKGVRKTNFERLFYPKMQDDASLVYGGFQRIADLGLVISDIRLNNFIF